MLQRRLRAGEIERDGVGTGEGGVVLAYRDTEVADPGEFAGVLPAEPGRMSLERANEFMFLVSRDDRDEQTAHPAASARHDKVSHRAPPRSRIVPKRPQ